MYVIIPFSNFSFLLLNFSTINFFLLHSGFGSLICTILFKFLPLLLDRPLLQKRFVIVTIDKASKNRRTQKCFQQSNNMLTSKNGNMRTSLGLKTKESHVLGQRGHILGQVSHLGQSSHILGQVSHLTSGVLGCTECKSSVNHKGPRLSLHP